MSTRLHDLTTSRARPVTDPERAMERWASLARRALGAAEAWITLREERARGLPGGSGAAGGDRVLLVPDLRMSAPGRTPSVVVPRNAQAYAEAPIRDPRGRVVGWLSAMEARPRGWTEADAAILEDVAAAAATEIALWSENRARARAEAALERSEARFRSIFESAAIGVALIGADGRLIRTNTALQRILGSAEEKLRCLPFLGFLHPEERPAVYGVLERMLGGGGEHSAEHRLLRPDGRTLWAQVTATLVRDSDGRPLCALALVADVTERRRAEEALTESQRQLVLAQRMEAVGRLAGGLAHDFNNLLTAIGSFAQLVQAELEPGSEPAFYVSEIRRASARAAILTRQLLAFSRQQVLRPQRLLLNRVVRELENMLRRLISENVELTTELDPALPSVHADPGQIEQVVVNLVVNARDALPHGGRITVRTRAAELTPEDARAHLDPIRPGRYARLSVSDTGHGMDEETLARIFEPFFTTKEPGKGTGLGLSTVYGIVKQSGGYIWARSQPGEGTTFELYLPAAEGAEARPEEGGRPDPVPGGAETVLLVEDEDTIRRLSERILRRQGYTVLAAAHADDALRLYEQHAGRIDLLLTDLVMPGMSGRTLAEHLLTRSPGMSVLLVSGYTADSLEQYGLASGGFTLLDKPFTPDMLARAVREALDRRKGGGEGTGKR